jgi:hypothetical protein
MDKMRLIVHHQDQDKKRNGKALCLTDLLKSNAEERSLEPMMLELKLSSDKIESTLKTNQMPCQSSLQKKRASNGSQSDKRKPRNKERMKSSMEEVPLYMVLEKRMMVL